MATKNQVAVDVAAAHLLRWERLWNDQPLLQALVPDFAEVLRERYHQLSSWRSSQELWSMDVQGALISRSLETTSALEPLLQPSKVASDIAAAKARGERRHRKQQA